MNNQEGRDIAGRTSKIFLQVRISQNIRSIRSLEHDITYQRNEILYMLDKQYVSAVENLREKAYRDRSNNKCKERQKKKFDLLLLSRMGHEGKMNKVYEDKWVANHSSRVLSEKEKEVLSKGHQHQ